MNSIYLVTTLVFLLTQSVIRKLYSEKTNGAGVYTFNVFAGIGALIFFLLTMKDPVWDLRILPYAFIFAVSYLSAGIFGLKAIAVGSLSLTSLITNFSLIIPTFYGLLFLGERGSVFFFFGVAALLVALVLVNKSSDSTPITGKWLFYVAIAFAGNGMCSLSQTLQQNAFQGAGKNEFMILALLFVVLGSTIMMLLQERKNIRVYIKHGTVKGLACGIANGIVNMLVMVLLGTMPASVVFPLITGGSIVFTYVISRTAFREKLSKRQTIGFVLGVASIILLNL